MSRLLRRARSIRKGHGLAVLAAIFGGLVAPSAALSADVEPPKLVSASASPSLVNVTGGAAAITVTFRLTDETGVVLPVVSGDSDLSSETTPAGTVTRVSGDAKDGTYKAKLTVAKGAVGGGWTASAPRLADTLGNATAGPVKLATFSVFSFGFDTVAPKLASSALSATAADVTTGPQTVNVTLRVTDDYTGAMPPVIDVVSPGGVETKTIGNAIRTFGDGNDGTYGIAIVIPRETQAGAWSVVLRPLRDYAGNAERSTHALGTVTVKSAAPPITPGTPPKPGAPAPPPTPPTPAAAPAALPGPADQGAVLGARATSRSILTFAGKRRALKVSAKGTLSIALKCTGIDRCKGSVRLFSKVRGKKVKVVSKRVSVRAGKTAKVAFKLTRKGRTVLARGRAVKLSASVWTDGTKTPRTRSLAAERAR